MSDEVFCDCGHSLYAHGTNWGCRGKGCECSKNQNQVLQLLIKKAREEEREKIFEALRKYLKICFKKQNRAEREDNYFYSRFYNSRIRMIHGLLGEVKDVDDKDTPNLRKLKSVEKK